MLRRPLEIVYSRAGLIDQWDVVGMKWFAYGDFLGAVANLGNERALEGLFWTAARATRNARRAHGPFGFLWRPWFQLLSWLRIRYSGQWADDHLNDEQQRASED